MDPVFPCILIVVSVLFPSDYLTHTEVVPVGARGAGVLGDPRSISPRLSRVWAAPVQV